MRDDALLVLRVLTVATAATLAAMWGACTVALAWRAFVFILGV